MQWKMKKGNLKRKKGQWKKGTRLRRQRSTNLGRGAEERVQQIRAMRAMKWDETRNKDQGRNVKRNGQGDMRQITRDMGRGKGKAKKLE